MQEQLITFETAKLAKEKGFNICTKKVFVETLEHTLEMGRGGDCTFPYHAPRVLDSGKFEEYDIIHCNAPTQSLLQKWLREVHNIHLNVEYYPDRETKKYCITGDYKTLNQWTWIDHEHDINFNTYEEALELGLKEGLELIEIVKTKQLGL
jgi:hypothetical protein